MRRLRNITLLTTCLLFFGFWAYAQQGLVSGVVVDNEGVSLPGVSIVVQGTTNGTISSIDGKYALVGVKPTDTIRFSFVGYETITRLVNGNPVINVIMKESTEMLEDVQVVAFQKQKKESVIASINTIKPGELKQPTSNLTTALAGRMSGVIAYQRSGEPGRDNAEFFIRGVTSFGYKNSPLILIDGLEVSSEDLARIEPDNIASFSIMKDATATSLYGARGANGVILVTTKEGKKGKARVAFRYESNIATPTRTNDFLDGVSYMKLYNEAQRTRYPNQSARYTQMKIEGTENNLNPEYYPNVDWYGELFNNYTLNNRANLNVSGGGEVATYYLSASYTNETGLLKVDPVNNFNNNIDIKRYNLRANINIDLTKTTEIAVKFSSLIDRYNGPVVDANNIFNSIMNANPVNFPMYYSKDETTKFYNHILFGNSKADGSAPNPYADMIRGYKDRFSSTVLSQIQLIQDLSFITDGLQLRGLASIRNYSSNENQYSYEPFFYEAIPMGSDFYLHQLVEGTEYLNRTGGGAAANSRFYFEGALQYDRVFKEKHTLGALLVAYRTEALNTLGNTYLGSFPYRNLGISGRLTYGYDSRYLMELNFGYNGSEKFAKDHRYGFFPSAGFAWVASKEKFFEGLLPYVNLLKLKYTYGLVGNDDISANNDDRFFYLSDANLNDAGRGYTFGGNYENTYPGYWVNRYENPLVTWEIAYKSNYGLELGLFNKATLQVDYFTERRDNIYREFQYIPETMGSTATISSNIGEAKSHGVDISLDVQHSFSSDFWLTSRANFTYATNEVLVNGEPDYQYEYMSRIGYPRDQPRGYVAQRLFVDDQEAFNSPNQFGQPVSSETYGAGDIKYVDINQDGKIDGNDVVPIGYPTIPEIVYGFGASMGYKNLDFSFFFQGSARQSFFIRTVDDGDQLGITPFINERNALSIIAENHWSETNPDPYAFWPRLSTTMVDNNSVASTWWLRDGSFLRLKSVELGYSLPRKIADRVHMSTIRAYFSGTNLLTFSKFKLWDPEMAGNGLSYPTQRVFNIGLQLNF